jgi:LytS/YehU family sensor histidine kinase
VRDTGMGLATQTAPGNGLALRNVRERLAALYGDAASLTLAPNLPQGAIAEIRMPLR